MLKYNQNYLTEFIQCSQYNSNIIYFKYLYRLRIHAKFSILKKATQKYIGFNIMGIKIEMELPL